jgi:hypothetical protein
LAEHINGDPEITKLIHLSDENFLSVEDPRFVFFLRRIDWARYREQIGFGPESRANYDFALSFAGPQRGLARHLYEALTEAGFAVFFDESERHQMLGEDLREYLAPIYASGAEFVLVILGPEYPKRYCVRARPVSRAYRETQRDPDLDATAEPIFASELTDKGAIVFSSATPQPEEIEAAIDDLGRKLEQRAAAASDPASSSEEQLPLAPAEPGGSGSATSVTK